MNKKNLLSSLLLAALTGLTLSGCPADSGSSMFMIGNLVPDAEDCVLDPTNNIFIGTGILDVGVAPELASSYEANFAVSTSLPATFRASDIDEAEDQSPNYPGQYGTTNTNVVFVQRSIITLSDVAGRPLDDAVIGNDVKVFPSADGLAREQQVSGVVFNQNANLDSRAVVTVQLVTLEEALALQNLQINGQNFQEGDTFDIFVTVQLEGQTSGGGQLVSPVFSYPIRLCKGCLLGANQADFDPDAGFTCPIAGQVPTLANPAACDPGQDSVVFTCQ